MDFLKVFFLFSPHNFGCIPAGYDLFCLFSGTARVQPGRRPDPPPLPHPWPAPFYSAESKSQEPWLVGRSLRGGAWIPKTVWVVGGLGGEAFPYSSGFPVHLFPFFLGALTFFWVVVPSCCDLVVPCRVPTPAPGNGPPQ